MKISADKLKRIIKEELEKVMNEQAGNSVVQNSELAPLIGKKLPYFGADQDTDTFKLGNDVFRAISEETGYGRSELVGIERVKEVGRLTNTEPLDMVTVTPVDTESLEGFKLVGDSGRTWLRSGTDWSDFYQSFVFYANNPKGTSDYPSDVQGIMGAENERARGVAAARQAAARKDIISRGKKLGLSAADIRSQRKSAGVDRSVGDALDKFTLQEKKKK